MIYLILAIACQFLIGMTIKWAQTVGEDTAGVVAVNYIPASILAVLFIYLSGEWGAVSPSTIWFGLGGGVLWPGSFFVFLFGIRRFGIAVAGPWARMAIIVPVLFGLIFLGESLTWPLGLGLLLTMTAVVLISPAPNNPTQRINPTLLWYIPLLLLAMGLTQLWSNLFRTYGITAENTLYIAGIFVWSIPFAWLYIWWFKIPVGRRTIFFGTLVGIPNFLNVVGILYGLQSPFFAERSAVLYTFNGGIVIVLLFLAGIFFWQETAHPRQYLGITTAIVALTLLNLF